MLPPAGKMGLSKDKGKRSLRGWGGERKSFKGSKMEGLLGSYWGGKEIHVGSKGGGG